jgi:hypothetical protein
MFPTQTTVLHRIFRQSITKMSTVSNEPFAERTAELLQSLAEIRARVKICSLPESTPILVAVSKYKPASDILVCHRNGHLDFGENYV